MFIFMEFDVKDKLLLTPKDIKPSFVDWEVKGVLNPGAIRLSNGKICLLVRVAEAPKKKAVEKGALRCPVIVSTKDGQDMKINYEKLGDLRVMKVGKRIIYLKDGQFRLTTLSHIRKVILSEDGFNVEEIIQEPHFTGLVGDGDYGVEDPRITKIGKNYLMTYVSVSHHEGVCTSLAVSKDLETWKRLGIIFREQNKDVVLFPEKIKGKYVALHRPEGNFVFSKPSVWISHSPDLIHWGGEKVVFDPRESGWDSSRIGAGPPPIKTKKGWLLIYHGVSVNKKGKSTYSAGAVLLDLKDPSKVLARSPKKKPLIKPDKSYEKKGFVPGVVFPEGIVPDKDGKSVLIYSGGSDDTVAVRKILVSDILISLEKV